MAKIRSCEFSDSCKQEVSGLCEDHRKFAESKSGLFLAIVFDHLDPQKRIEGTVVEFDSLAKRDLFVTENPGTGFGQRVHMTNPF